jgi:hypothetical protein
MKETKKLGHKTSVVVLFIIVAAVLWFAASAQAQEAEPDTCFKILLQGSAATVYACDSVDYRVVVTRYGKVVSGGLLSSDLPCEIFYIEPGSTLCIRRDGEEDCRLERDL